LERDLPRPQRGISAEPCAIRRAPKPLEMVLRLGKDIARRCTDAARPGGSMASSPSPTTWHAISLL
jgi:hypothetical protein